MRLNPRTPKIREGPKILYLPKPLLRFGYAGLLILATLGNLTADDLPAPVTPANAEPLPNPPANPANTSTTDNSQNSNNSQTPNNNSQTPDNTQTSENSQTPTNPQDANTPLLPLPAANAYTPISSTGSTAQSSPLTEPLLNSTGAYDLSQVATSAALLQAFSQQEAAGFWSEPGMGYSYGPIERIRLGPFNLKFALTMDVVSDDNLLASEGNEKRTSDTSFGITPAILLEYGAQPGQKGYASLVYTPTLTRYFQHSDENADNQNIAFNAHYPFQKLTLDLSQTYAQVTGINQDLSARTTQTSSVSTVGGNYDIDDKLSLSSHLQELITSFSGGAGQGDTVSSLNTSLSYHLSEKMTLGPGLNVGLEKPEGATKQTFEQPLLQLNYQATEKITLFGQGGVEFRQYDHGGDTTNPVFSAGIAYAPFDSTRLSLNAYQTVQSSTADSQQTSVNTGVGFTATQRIVQRFYLGFSFNYSHSEYQTDTGSAVQVSGTTPAGTPATFGSTQDNLVYRPSLSYAPSEWTSVAIYYQYLDNESNGPGGGYHDNQMGLSVSAQF